MSLEQAEAISKMKIDIRHETLPYDPPYVIRWYSSKVRSDGTVFVSRSVHNCNTLDEAEDKIERLCIENEKDPFFRAAHFEFESQLLGVK